MNHVSIFDIYSDKPLHISLQLSMVMSVLSVDEKPSNKCFGEGERSEHGNA